MNLQDFKELLKSTDKKMNIFSDFNVIENINFSINELIELIKLNLSSEEILNLFNYTYYQQLPDTLRNDLISFMELPINSAIWAILAFDEECKKMFLTNKTFILKNFSTNMIPVLCNNMDETIKEKILKLYSEEPNVKVGIYKQYTDSEKFEILTAENDLSIDEKCEILFSLNDENIGLFLYQNPNFCEENGITKADFMSKLLECERKLVSNRYETDGSLDITDFPPEYRECIDFNLQNSKEFIVIDLNSDLEKYRGLDKFIRINPQEFSEEKIKKLMKLCEICPNLQVCNRLGNESKSGASLYSSGEEYKEAEEWISYVISKLKPEYTTAQKIAIIDNEIGKKISYSPNFGTKNFNESNARCLWKIISSGYGVCNGIANVEQYIFNRTGVESEFIASSNHAFLKVKNVDIELADGQLAIINGILDPTWNLAAHRFGGQPENFLISYEEARKHDIDKHGKDFECHVCDKKLQDLNFTLADDDLRQLFCGVGITNVDGSFPLKTFMDSLKNIDAQHLRNPHRNYIPKIKHVIKSISKFVILSNGIIKIIRNYLNKYA